MAGLTERNEYYWIANRVVQRKAHRTSGLGPWPKSADRKLLVIAVEQGPSGFEVKKGPAYTSERARDALLMEHGLFDTSSAPDIGKHIPKTLLSQIKQQVAVAEQRITSRFRNLSNEERTTGVLFDHLEGVYSDSGWSVRITSQGYSSAGSEAKEKKVGADVGIIIDIADNNSRVLKVLWLQAKRTEEFPSDILRLPDLKDQLSKMRARTRDGYALIYTPQGVHVFSSAAPSIQIGLNNLLGGALECVRGDRDPSLLVDTIDKNFVLEVLVSAPP